MIALLENYVERMGLQPSPPHVKLEETVNQPTHWFGYGYLGTGDGRRLQTELIRNVRVVESF